MRQSEFLLLLEQYLSPLSVSERQEILADYQSHFQSGASLGLSELEICARLGNPIQIAHEYLADRLVYRQSLAESGATPLPFVEPEGKPNPRQLPLRKVVLRLMSLGWIWLILLMPLGVSLIIASIAIFVSGVAAVPMALFQAALLLFNPTYSVVTSPLATWLLITGQLLLGVGMIYFGFLISVRMIRTFIIITRVMLLPRRVKRGNKTCVN